QYLADMVNTTHPASIQRIQADLATVATANLKQFISDRGVMLDKAVLIDHHITEQVQRLKESYRLTQIQIGQFAGLNVFLSRFGSEVNGYIGMSINSGYEFNAECQQPYSSLLHVVRNAIAAKLATAQENLERDRQELPILENRVSQPFDQAQEYEQKSNRLGFLKEMFDAIAHEAPVDDSESECAEREELDESREIFWERDSSAAPLEPPSTAIIEALRQRHFEDWVADETENWLEQIAQLVGDLDLPVSSDRIGTLSELNEANILANFRLVGGGEKLTIPQKNVDQQREQLTLF
ncbi:hypothetical protein, partial [Pseudanabaena sp. FACHB-1998]|uniref:hypothetical protein n=1 Tax=Pseudanabaena sp. FACHB-1998 TaxID=2692858 RepID=UPI001A7EAB52